MGLREGSEGKMKYRINQFDIFIEMVDLGPFVSFGGKG